VVTLFAALVSSRLLLIVLNWTGTARASVVVADAGHGASSAVGLLWRAVRVGGCCLYGRWQRLPLWTTADALAAPLALGLAFEQLARCCGVGLWD